MSGEIKDERAAWMAGDDRHVAACLAQGGFARVVIDPARGGVLHIGPDGAPWRHIPDGVPLPAGRTGKVVPLVIPDPVLVRQEPLTVQRVMLDGVRYRPGRVHALQLLADGGVASVTVRSLAKAMDTEEGPVGSLIVAMVGDGLTAHVGKFAGRPRTALYAITDQGRQVLAKLTAMLNPDPSAAPVLDTREVRVLDVLGRRTMNLSQLVRELGLGQVTMRTLLASMTERRLLKRQVYGSQHRWRATSRAREALSAGRAAA